MDDEMRPQRVGYLGRQHTGMRRAMCRPRCVIRSSGVVGCLPPRRIRRRHYRARRHHHPRHPLHLLRSRAVLRAERRGVAPAGRRPRVGWVSLVLEPALAQRVVVDVVRPAERLRAEDPHIAGEALRGPRGAVAGLAPPSDAVKLATLRRRLAAHPLMGGARVAALPGRVDSEAHPPREGMSVVARVALRVALVSSIVHRWAGGRGGGGAAVHVAGFPVHRAGGVRGRACFAPKRLGHARVRPQYISRNTVECSMRGVGDGCDYEQIKCSVPNAGLH
mmetsp:Transcript_21401/g.46941  ORF Transcript_21401/g.46941 Transcript_21401/m.46941 type:complete len:277 (-) Transcript_21401:139-969(-)